MFYRNKIKTRRFFIRQKKTSVNKNGVKKETETKVEVKINNKNITYTKSIKINFNDKVKRVDRTKENSALVKKEWIP